MPGSPLDLGALPSLDDVEFVERLGAGLGAGRFKARLAGGDLVSLLLEDPTLIDRDRFAAWGRAMAALDHPGLARVVRVEDALQPGFVAFAYVDGQNLEARLALRGEGLVELDALSVVLQAAAAVRAAHRAGVAHGALNPRAVVLVDRPGGLDGVVVVGWAPPAVEAPFEERARADLKALGSLLYVALTGVAPPSSQRLEVDGLEGGGGAFDDILMDWVDVERDLGGLGRPALDALADSGRYADVPAFIDALVPHFREKVQGHLDTAARALDEDRAFMDEVERQRGRLRELEARQRAVREWLHTHARRIERCDGELSRLRARVAALQSIETEMGLLAGQAGRPAARLPDRFDGFDRRRGWSDPPAGLEVDGLPGHDPVVARRGLDRADRFERGPAALRPSGGRRAIDPHRGGRTRTGGFAVADDPVDALPLDPEDEAEAPPADPVVLDAPEAEPDEAPAVVDEAPVALDEPRRERARPHDEPVRGSGGVLVGALGVAVVLGVLAAAWLLAGTDGGPRDPARPPAVKTGAVAPMPEAAPEAARPEAPTPEAPTPEAPTAAALPESPPPESPAPESPPPEAPAPAIPPPEAPAPDELTFEPIALDDGPGEPPEGMVAVPAGLVRAGLAEPQRAAAMAQCARDLEGYPEAWCAERLGPSIEPVVPPRPVGPLFADRTEVDQRAYTRCVVAGVCGPLNLRWDLDEQPATGVTRDMAAAYCAWREARLPTADEWLYIARGGDDRLYPWGDEPPGEGRAARANYGRFTHKGGLPERADRHKYAAPIDSFGEAGESPFGARDMAGNVREWTSTELDGQGVTLGGGWREAPFELRVTRVERAPLDTSRNDLGFRCVIDPGAVEGEEAPDPGSPP